MKFIVKIFTGLVLLTVFSGCKNNPLDIDVSSVQLEPLKLQRLEEDVFSINQKNIEQKTLEINKKYGTFYNRFVSSILNTGGVRDSSYKVSVLKFVNDTLMRRVYKQSESLLKPEDVSSLENEITLCCKRFKYHFPKRKLPTRLVSFVSGFNPSVVYVDSTIGIGLDKYLGSQNDFYTRMLQWPRYQTRTMQKEYILGDVARGWLITEFDTNEPVNNLLHHMIFYGKIFYACDALLPDVTDSLKIGYTTAQMKDCKEHEKMLWEFFAEKNRLFDNNLKTIAEFTADGPFTAAIGRNCPPRIAMWIGWQVVKNYMKNNPKVSLEELMEQKDPQVILSKSKYRP